MHREEFENLAIAEIDAVYRFARFLTRDAARADDLVQDVYARAFRAGSIENFRTRGGGMRVWLLTIARTCFFGSIEKDKAGRRAMTALTAMTPRSAMTAAPATSAASNLEHCSHRDVEAPDPGEIRGLDPERAGPALLEAMDSLRPDLREVLWLWGVEGMKYREIADATGVPIGTVMSRLHRARTHAARRLMRTGPAATPHAELLKGADRT